ncbi:MAG: trypsin-like peptidase domain-containing protein [archaeon]|nr:trypsin-like peptidase domain-containing protein [archaeon]MCP8306723.1 trypsin-like peptidase domain-containing protein [archaeon]
MSEKVVPKILQSLSDAVVEVANEVAPSVVSVGLGRRVGSGVVWSADGYIITASHVIGKLDSVNVSLGGQRLEAKVVGRDPYSDIALLKTEGGSFRPIELGNSEKLKVGQFILAFANPSARQPSVASGIVASARTSIRGWWGVMTENVIVTDVRLNSGYSGSPLVDASGRMVGLNIAHTSSQGIAVPVSTVKDIADRLAREGKIRRAYLGVVSNNISLPKEIATEPQISQDVGAMVLSVEADSPAKQAGLSLGDVIVKLDGKSVTSVYDLPRLLTEEVIGKRTKLLILRGGQLMELEITPSERRDF